VFQNPLSSLDPRMRVAASVAEPLDALGIGDAASRRRRVAELLDLVGLPADLGRRTPAALSGGERQRAAIARALAPGPELLVLDEPVSSIDATAALRVIDLLQGLRARAGLALVLVSHDVDVVRELCGRLVVMQAGRVVESGPTDRVLAEPEHVATRRLVEAAPRPVL
jgi:peptide/nickel transport system ATP-binding protein